MNSLKELVLLFPQKACSFQQMKIGKNGMYKTKYQNDFEESVNLFLCTQKQAIKAFSEGFDEKVHVITAKWIFTYKDFFTNKDKTISSWTLDLDNSGKNFQDIVFKHLGLNDKNIVHQESIKWSGKDQIFLKLKLLEREDFERFIFN